MSRKVLLVDDVSMFIELEKDYLQLSAVKIFTARDGQEAFRICQTERPDLVFMDLQMPVMNGADSCRAIKGNRQLQDTAVVLIASEGKDTDRQLSLEAGCDRFLTKPLDRNAFLEAAHSLLPAIDRRDRRINCRVNVKFRAFGLTLSGFVVNLSQHGLYLGSDCSVERGAMIDLIFALPEPDGSIIQTKARVAWLNTKESRLKPSLPFGFGLEFVSCPDEAARTLARFIEQQPEAV